MFLSIILIYSTSKPKHKLSYRSCHLQGELCEWSYFFDRRHVKNGIVSTYEIVIFWLFDTTQALYQTTIQNIPKIMVCVQWLFVVSPFVTIWKIKSRVLQKQLNKCCARTVMG